MFCDVVSGERLTWISRAWYMIIRPSNITVERLIRHFSANEYEDSYSRREKRGREDVVSDAQQHQGSHLALSSYFPLPVRHAITHTERA